MMEDASLILVQQVFMYVFLQLYKECLLQVTSSKSSNYNLRNEHEKTEIQTERSTSKFNSGGVL